MNTVNDRLGRALAEELMRNINGDDVRMTDVTKVRHVPVIRCQQHAGAHQSSNVLCAWSAWLPVWARTGLTRAFRATEYPAHCLQVAVKWYHKQDHPNMDLKAVHNSMRDHLLGLVNARFAEHEDRRLQVGGRS